jgi:hypothetical protein
MRSELHGAIYTLDRTHTLQRENTVSSPLYVGLCGPGLVPVGTFQTVS